MPFKRFVETGRVAYITGGRYSGRLCSIVDVIDQTRALVDGPKTGVPRVPVRLSRLRLTKHVIKFPYTGSTKVVRKAWEDNKTLQKWREAKWAGNLVARKTRRRLNDFDRFKLRYARKIRNKLRTIEYKKLLKEDNRKREKLRLDNKGKKGYNRRPRKNEGKDKKKSTDKKAKGKPATPKK